jgi:O-antigen/teichoic acid export membrane protein
VTHAAPTRLGGLAMELRRPELGRSIARTAAFNIAATGTAGLGGVLLARLLGPTIRGEYAAITAWFGVALIVGQIGQPAALCFYVAKDPRKANEYVATSRAMTLATGTLALAIGLLIAPVLAHGQPDVTLGYRIIFSTSIVAFVSASYTSSLQARDLNRWNLVRTSQPALGLVMIIAVWKLHLLNLENALLTVTATMVIQFVWAYSCCRQTGLAPGHANFRLIRPLAKYGATQIAALTPATLNAQLDQLVLSQTVPAAELGRYAVAVSLTLLPLPLVSAIGYVAFPRLAAQKESMAATNRLQRLAVVGAAGMAAAVIVPLAVAAYWLVPIIFGARYSGAVPLIWILTPGAIFLACGQVLGDLLRGRNRPMVVAMAQGIAAIFTVTLLIVLLPIIGIYGAAIATSVAYGVALASMLRVMWVISADEGKNKLKAQGV